jgi:hypothetical protein
MQVIEIVLAMGNYLNGTGAKGGAHGFKLEFLTKLADTKTADNKSTLLHYLVSYIEKRNKDLLGFPQDLSNVEIGAKVVGTNKLLPPHTHTNTQTHKHTNTAFQLLILNLWDRFSLASRCISPALFAID